VSEREWNPVVANQPQSQKKKEKELFLPNCPTVVMTHTQTQSFFRCRGSHFIQKREKTKQKVFFLVRDHPSPMQMNLFRLSEDVPLVVAVVVVLVPSFFLANGFLICSLARAHADTHTPKSSQSKTAADKKNTLEGEEEEEEEGEWKKKLSEAPGIRTHDRNHFMIFILLSINLPYFILVLLARFLFFFFF